MFDTMDVQDLVENHRIIQDGGDFLVVERINQFVETPNLSELGNTGMTAYGNMGFRGEYNNDLRGYLGLRTYDRMRRSESQVKMALRLIKTPVYAARWFVNPASSAKRDKKIASEIWKNFTDQLSVSWAMLLLESLSHLDFGWYSFEPVYQKVNGKVLWKKFSPRHPLDCSRWLYDINDGGPKGAYFHQSDGTEKFIPIKETNGQTRLLTFTLDKEGGDMEGVSALRPIYKNYYYKDNLLKIDAIQKERHGIGIPIIKLPNGYTTDDKNLANNLGRNLRTNERAHVVIPERFVVEMLKLEGQPVDVIKSVQYHDTLMARGVLAPFSFNDTGLITAESQELFLKGARFIADSTADVFNKWAIPDWVRFNYSSNVEPPKLTARNIGDTVDWRTISFALRNLIGAQIIQPDDDLETYMRDQMDLPLADTNSIRKPATPQGPQAAKGNPKQSKAGNMKKDTGSNGRVGKDGGSTGN